MEKIALWGAGKAGKYMLSNVSERYEICAIVDNNASNVRIGNVPVMSPQDYVVEIRDELVGILICITNEMIIPDIVKQMAELGIRKAGIFRKPISFEEPLHWEEIIWFNPMEKSFLPYLETNIIDRCNLNCKGCSHFSNLFSASDHEEETIEDLKHDLEQLSKHVFVRKFRILGGEPFLSSNLKDYIEAARRYLPDTDIRVVTNGTMLLQVEEALYQKIKENDVTLDITAYPCIGEKKQAIRELLDGMDIHYTFSPDVSVFFRRLDLKGKNAPRTSYDTCSDRVCRFLRRGKLYTCPIEGIIYKYAQMYQINEFNDLLPYLGLNIHEKDMNWRNVYHKQAKPGLLCRFCAENGGEEFLWEVSANPKKEEWLVEIEEKDGYEEK